MTGTGVGVAAVTYTHKIPTCSTYDTTWADIGATFIPIVMVSVGIDDGTFAGSPFAGVTVTLLAANSTALARRVTDDRGLVRFHPLDLPPAGNFYHVILDGGYDADRYECPEGIGQAFTPPDVNFSGSFLLHLRRPHGH